MAIENLSNENSHLSGAYIRSLVKQLTTTTPTSKPCLNTPQNFTINNNDTLSLVPNYANNPMTNKTTKKQQAMAKSNHNQDQSQGHKKQVRRRLHTSRPYQERLLNMAEARKEIVTALKFHRASMKQANDQKQQHQQQQLNNQQQITRDHNNYDNSSRKVKSEQLSVDNMSYHYQPSHNNRNYSQNYYPPSNIISTTTTPMYDSLNNIPLPNQTLGLNLNLQAFTNLDTNFYHNNNINTFTTSNTTTTTTTTTSTNSHPSTEASPSSPSTPVSITTTSTMEAVGPTSGDSSNNSMHPCLDEDEIAKMRSIGEQYQVEWDDTLNLVKSAWWFKFLKTVDFGNNKDIKHGCYNHNTNDRHDISFEDELMEFPPWLSPSNDESFLHQQLDDSCSEDNTTLPWMDIEDIDGMDDEWLS